MNIKEKLDLAVSFIESKEYDKSLELLEELSTQPVFEIDDNSTFWIRILVIYHKARISAILNNELSTLERLNSALLTSSMNITFINWTENTLNLIELIKNTPEFAKYRSLEAFESLIQFIPPSKYEVILRKNFPKWDIFYNYIVASRMAKFAELKNLDLDNITEDHSTLLIYLCSCHFSIDYLSFDFLKVDGDTCLIDKERKIAIFHFECEFIKKMVKAGRYGPLEDTGYNSIYPDDAEDTEDGPSDIYLDNPPRLRAHAYLEHKDPSGKVEKFPGEYYHINLVNKAYMIVGRSLIHFPFTKGLPYPLLLHYAIIKHISFVRSKNIPPRMTIQSLRVKLDMLDKFCIIIAPFESTLDEFFNNQPKS